MPDMKYRHCQKMNVTVSIYCSVYNLAGKEDGIW